LIIRQNIILGVYDYFKLQFRIRVNLQASETVFTAPLLHCSTALVLEMLVALTLNQNLPDLLLEDLVMDLNTPLRRVRTAPMLLCSKCLELFRVWVIGKRRVVLGRSGSLWVALGRSGSLSLLQGSSGVELVKWRYIMLIWCRLTYFEV